MSLIQEALEKAGRLSQPESNDSPPGDDHVVALADASEKEWLLADDSSTSRQPSHPTSRAARAVQKEKIIIWGILIFFSSFAVIQFLLFGTKFLFPSKAQAVTLRSLPASLSSLMQSPHLLERPFRLTGITVSGGKRMALINNQVVGVGERLKDAETVVQAIWDHEVTLNSKGREIKLSL